MIEGVVVAALVVAFAAIAGVAAWTVWRLWTGADPGGVGHIEDMKNDVEAGGRAVDRR